MRALTNLVIKTSRLSLNTLTNKDFSTVFTRGLSSKTFNRNRNFFEPIKSVSNLMINSFRKNSQVNNH